jgi:hypothetical protein
LTQDSTWDAAIAVGVDGLYREGAYVQLSRGANTNLLVVTDTEIAELYRAATTDVARHDSPLPLPDEQPDDVRDDLVTRLTRTAAKRLAHHHDPDLDTIDKLARTNPVPTLQRLHDAVAAAERAADLRCGEHGPDLLEQANRITDVASHVAVGVRVSPTDRHNVGVITALDDHRGTVQVHFVSEDGREATRSFTWDQLRLLDPTDARPLPDTAQRLIDLLHQRHHEWASAVRSHGVEPGDADRYRWAIDRRIDSDTHHLLAEPPTWLSRLLGDRPADVAGAVTYDDTVRTIVAWRAHQDLPSAVEGLGPRPDHDGHQWDDLAARVATTRHWLATSDRLTPDTPATRTENELLDRLGEVDAILDTAPPDWQPLVAQLRAGQLTLDDTDTILGDALTGQHTRRRWILEHWPHVVEHHEISAALANQPPPALGYPATGNSADVQSCDAFPATPMLTLSCSDDPGRYL